MYNWSFHILVQEPYKTYRVVCAVEVTAVRIEGFDVFDKLRLELRLNLEEFRLDLGGLDLEFLPGVAQRVALLCLFLVDRQVMLD